MSESSGECGGTIVAIVAADVKPGKEAEFEQLARELFALMQRKNYGTDRLLLSRQQPNLYYDIRDWTSPQAAEQAHRDADVHALWARLDEVCKITHVVGSAHEVRV